MGWLGDGADNALLAAGNETPEADPDRYRGYGGPSIGAAGETHLVAFDIPTEPLVSLGQLQHAALGRYSHDPSYIVGNSYHNVRIPLGETEQKDFANHDTGGAYTATGLDVFDLSYRCNEALWDSHFFSTIDPDMTDAELAELRDRSEDLRNSRLRLHDPTGALQPSDLTTNSDEELYHSIGGRLLLDGAFNINSTSTAAWKALLSSVADLQVPVYDTEDGENRGLVRRRRQGRLLAPRAPLRRGLRGRGGLQGGELLARLPRAEREPGREHRRGDRRAGPAPRALPVALRLHQPLPPRSGSRPRSAARHPACGPAPDRARPCLRRERLPRDRSHRAGR